MNSFAEQLTIDGRPIGPDQPVYVIAEVGTNHNQDLSRARNLVDRAREAGADAVKFQCLKYEQQYSINHKDEDYREFFSDIETPAESWYGKLAEYADDRDITFLSSPTYLEAVDLLDELDVSAYKIASAQLGTFSELVEKAASKGKPLIMSTGLSGYGRIKDQLNRCLSCGNDRVVLLHCVSEYPAAPDVLNLEMIRTYRRMFGCLTGFSDHSEGIDLISSVVALGAVVVEKHITYDSDAPGPDHEFAIEPDELSSYVDTIRKTEEALGNGVRLELTTQEHQWKQEFKPKWIVDREIPEGTQIQRSHLRPRRTDLDKGIFVDNSDRVFKQVTARDLKEGELLRWEDLRYE